MLSAVKGAQILTSYLFLELLSHLNYETNFKIGVVLGLCPAPHLLCILSVLHLKLCSQCMLLGLTYALSCEGCSVVKYAHLCSQS